MFFIAPDMFSVKSCVSDAIIINLEKITGVDGTGENKYDDNITYPIWFHYDIENSAWEWEYKTEDERDKVYSEIKNLLKLISKFKIKKMSNESKSIEDLMDSLF